MATVATKVVCDTGKRKATMSVVETNEELETWRNTTNGRVFVTKIGEYGKKRDELIASGGVVHISARDRRLNQERAADPSMDIFTDGTLTPVRVGESAAEFASNPNLLTEEDMRQILQMESAQFAKRLSSISNPSVVKRMVELAHEEDCAVSRLETLSDRVEELTEVKTVKTDSREETRSTTPFPVVRL